MPTGEFPEYFSEKEAAAKLTVSISTLRRWRRGHSGPDHLKFGGVLRYSRRSLENFIDKNTKSSK